MFPKLLEMSVTSGILILIIIFIRACFFKVLPKKVFVLLWIVVLFKLLVPISLTSNLSIYSLIESNFNVELGSIKKQNTLIHKDANDSKLKSITDNPDINYSGRESLMLNRVDIMFFGISIVFSAFLLFKYIRTTNLFKTSIHIKNHEFIKKWICENKCFRKFAVCMSEFTRTPLTAGILKPSIILPKQMDYENNQTLNFVLTHELVHINRFDNVMKLFMLVGLVVHWFNPFVWVMLFLVNKDLEFSCDEKVMSIVGEECRADYATALITLAEEQNTFPMTLCNGFGKTKIEERIVNVMKFKKSTCFTLLISFVLICGTTVVFATGNKELNKVEGFSLDTKSYSYDEESLAQNHLSFIPIISEEDIISTPIYYEMTEASVALEPSKIKVKGLTDIQDGNLSKQVISIYKSLYGDNTQVATSASSKNGDNIQTATSASSKNGDNIQISTSSSSKISKNKSDK